MDFKQQLIKAYDQDAKRRDEAEGKRDHWKLDLREKFVRLLNEENKKTILELGAGAGLDAKYFQDQEFDVLATDLSPEMVKMCQKRGLEAKVVDLYELDTLGKAFDGIYSLNVLLHVPRKDLEKTLKIINQTLNSGGIFFSGNYGGNDEEFYYTNKNKIKLPRFFSLLSDQTLLEVVKDHFEILDFQTIKVKSDRPGMHFQALFLRKK